MDPDSEDAWSDRQRTRLESAIELALRHGALDTDTISRLRSPDSETFWGKFNELKVAVLAEAARIPLSFTPAGRGSTYGEFILSLAGIDVFTEVKTLFPRAADRDVERTLTILRKAARTLECSAFISLQVHQAATRHFRGDPFIQFLKRELPKLSISGQRFPAVRYTDEGSGVVADVTLIGTPELPHIFTGAVIDHPEAEDVAIQRALAKAVRQIPEGTPSLVVICSQLGHPIDHAVIGKALYGSFVVIQENGNSTGGRLPNGFFKPGKNTRISAVAFLDEFRVDQPLVGHLDVFDNPWSATPIEPRQLLPLSDRQCHAAATLVDGRDGLRLSYPYQPDPANHDDSD